MNKEKILIVEDDSDINSLLCKIINIILLSVNGKL